MDCRKVIIDSSKNRFDNSELIKSSGFEYVYYGPTVYIEKMHKIYHDLVNTEFVLDCSDDDIVLKRSIKECVQFLRHHNDYSACDGQNIWLDKKNKYMFEGVGGNKMSKYFTNQYWSVEDFNFSGVHTSST